MSSTDVKSRTFRVETTRFGVLEVPLEEVFTFPGGLPGFEQHRRFVLRPNPSGGPLEWLQSVEDGDLAFLVCQPQLFKPDYRVPIRKEDIESIDLAEGEMEHALIYCMIVVPNGNIREMTANLLGPLILNGRDRIGRQFVLAGTDYTTKHRVFQDQR